MAELMINKINPETAHTSLKEFMAEHVFVPLFFFSPYSANTWLNHDTKRLCILTLGEEKLLAVYRENEDDIRILFDIPSNDMIAAVQEKLHPKFFSVNESVIKPDVKSFYDDTEYRILIEPIADLKDKGVRKNYNRAVRNNSGLTYVPYKPEHVPAITKFLEKWNTTRSELQNAYARTQNDLRFLKMYGNGPKLVGGVIFDKDEVVGYRLGIETLDGNILALFNKVLRGYTELGTFLYVEGMRQLAALGYKEAYIGSVNNDFKEQFLQGSTAIGTYSYIIHNELTLKNEGRYLMKIF